MFQHSNVFGHAFTVVRRFALVKSVGLVRWGMKLSLVERMLMAQNFQILAKLEPENAETYEWRAEVLRNGYEPLYSWLFEWFGQGDSIVTAEEGEYVYEVLRMYDAITWSIQRQGIELPENLKYRATFPGFDGNDEGKLLGFANHYCTEGRYDILKKDGEIPNSHFPTRSTYGPMLSKWQTIKGSREGLLTEEQVLELLRAKDQ